MTATHGVVKELITGGQRSGKSRRAEALAQQWLQGPGHRAVFIATAQPWDEEMRERIARHQADRAAQLPGMRTLEVPLALGHAIAAHSSPDTLVVVDCLTLWLTNLLMPASDSTAPDAALTAEATQQATLRLLEAIQTAKGPVVLVGNEIGMGVVPLGAQVRSFVDTLGRLNQDVASVCDRVTLMVAGLPLVVKGAA
jgi:adenosylcobinamide kinase/adenosylcobinamide-phosphate guanylyltransferase